MSYKKCGISKEKADEVLAMTSNEWRNHVIIVDGNPMASTLPGVEIEIEWENPDCAIISHFWIDKKLRGEEIGTTMCKETLYQLRRIPRVKFVTTSIQTPTKATKRMLQSSGFEEVVVYDHDGFDNQIAEGRIYFRK